MTAVAPKSMDEIMALCKRRGFVYPASEIYGGINGFWDYGPLGAQLKKNLRDAWWQDVVMNPCWGRSGPDGNPVEIVPVDTCIIQNPRVWEASGHVGGFNDPMIDCRETKARYRADHVRAIAGTGKRDQAPVFAFIKDSPAEAKQRKAADKKFGDEQEEFDLIELGTDFSRVLGPDAKELGTLTPPRAFNLMFKTYIGATAGEDDIAYLRPETAQGMFVQFKNVIDTTRVGVPFGIAQTGKAFRNEVTPRNFTFRSREFEQMEIEFFCHPDQANDWYAFWRDWRMEWWKSLGLAGENLILREHDRDELAHYAKDGAGTSDVEYRFPFTAPGYGELEGIAHRTDFDLRQHAEHSGLGDRLKYFDSTRGETAPNGQPKGEKYFPHVIEPSAGLDRGVLAALCEAFTPDPERPSGVFMKFHPRLSPIKAAVFPLVKKDGMPEKAHALTTALRKKFGHLGVIETDEKQSIGKRYARMDEAGCPFCFTIDSDTLADDTVTVRHRDTLAQERVAMDAVPAFLGEKLGV
tara:strand:- start:20246 stop:21811 length:1566 start_codon:yes stop_codon:yes gene_type:complete